MSNFLSRDDDAEDFGGAGTLQNRGAFRESSSSGSDVVDKPDIFPQKLVASGVVYYEGVFKIFEPFFTGIGFYLWLGVVDTKKSIGKNGEMKMWSNMLRESICKKLGLIESTKTKATLVKWYGNDIIGKRKICFDHLLREPETERLGEERDEAVFIGMDK